MNYQINKPYPEIKVIGKNEVYAKILLESYGGSISEDTAVHEYIYQHIVLKDIDEKLSNALLKISMVEMKHVSFLGEIINMLGLNPEFSKFNYFTNNYEPWNGLYLNYSTDILEMLKHDIKMEETAISQYKKSIHLINDPYIKNLLERIIEDEILHLHIFKTFYTQKNTN